MRRSQDKVLEVWLDSDFAPACPFGVRKFGASVFNVQGAAVFLSKTTNSSP